MTAQGLTHTEQEVDAAVAAPVAGTVDSVVWDEGATDPHLAGVRAITVDSPEWAAMIRQQRAEAEQARLDEMRASQQLAAQSAVKEAAGRFVIAAPAAQPGQVVGVGGVIFEDGVAVTDDLAVASYCQGAGYAVRDLQTPSQAADEEPAEATDQEGDGSEGRRVPRSR